MLKWVLGGVAAIVVIFLIAVALQPADFKVERSTTMRAPAPAAFAQVNDFQNWRAWSPWEKVDPALKRQYEGPKAGTGAVYAWQGNSDVGEGRMTITDSRPGRGAHQARILQAVRGDQYRRVQAICMFVNTDKMVGGMFEQGLTQMKTVVERRA